jgi:UDP-2,3-diacylglucosamine pyrophosphatase LpxH
VSPAGESGPTTVTRRLADDALLVFLSDCHIGGDRGRDIFESPDDLAALFNELAARSGPVELVLAGDFFDCLRIGSVPPGGNRISATIARPEYREVFAALVRLAAGKDARVVYMPGNHDAEVWWNAEIRANLERQGLVHEFALSYAATFESAPGQVVYCEHGNEFDTANMKQNYDDPLDTPLGDHIVTEIIPRLPGGSAAAALQLREIDHVFPLDTIPQWIAGRLFYTLVTQLVRWLLLPLLVAYVAFEIVAYLLGAGARAITELFVEITYDIALLLAAFGVFFLVARRQANRSIESTPVRPVEADMIRQRLEKGEPPPLAGQLPGEIAVFVSGHTHAPALAQFDRPAGGGPGVVVNSGCWLRQLQPMKAHFRAPAVFVNVFVQTHVRVFLRNGALSVELWEHPRPSRQAVRVAERLAIAGRLPEEPPANSPPRVRAAASVRVAPLA